MKRKLVIVGDGGCGKTCLLSCFTLGYFPTHYVPTVFEHYTVDCRVDGISVQLALWDTAGQEDYQGLRWLAYAQAHVVVIGFSIDNQESLVNVQHKWIPEVIEYCPGTPIILAGLKKDLRENALAIERVRKENINFASSGEGNKVAEISGARKYLECSSLTGEGVDNVFEAATRATLLSPGKERDYDGCCEII